MKRVKGAAEKPIVLTILPHTGRIDGDDTGYRDWPIKEKMEKEEKPDKRGKMAKKIVVSLQNLQHNRPSFVRCWKS
ncbi:MAG TPA: hypothetical protein PK295_02080 [Candidatus Magasanikbacteria bacterium]|nr:hypothetical protein [Candidatus Magasanikbacteria bacterium]